MTKLEKIQKYIQERIELLERRKEEHIADALKYHEVHNFADEEWEMTRSMEKTSAIHELQWLQEHIKEMK